MSELVPLPFVEKLRNAITAPKIECSPRSRDLDIWGPSAKSQQGRDRGIPPFRKVRGRMGHPAVFTALTPAPCDKAKAARDGPPPRPPPRDNKWRKEPDFRRNLGQAEVYCHRSTPRTRAPAPLDVSMTMRRFLTLVSVSLCLVSVASAAA